MSSDGPPSAPPLAALKSCKAKAFYNLIAYPTCLDLAHRMEKKRPDLFNIVKVDWGKFEDSGMDNIFIHGFSPVNIIKRSRILFLADFHSNDATFSQLHVLITLAESFIEDLIICTPYLPVSTMERVVREGEVATANTMSRILSHLPPIGRPARVMFYDLHTLQQRFYLHTNALASMHTAIPLILKEMENDKTLAVDAVAFPDEGAQKRFGKKFGKYPLVVCGKKRVGKSRKVTIQDGDCKGKRLLIVDDIVKTGGTLAACAKALKDAGALSVSAYCTHAGFPGDSAKRFVEGGDRFVFERFYVTNSNPTAISRLPDKKADKTGVFRVLDLMPLILSDL
eukprot:g2865.t1